MSTKRKRKNNDGDSGDQVLRQVALLRLSGDIAEAENEGEICRNVVDVLHETLGYDFLALFLLNEVNGNRDLAASVGFADPVDPLKPGEGLSEAVFLSGEMQYTPDVTKKDEYFYGMGGSEVDVPIWIGDEVRGVIVAESGEKNAFHDEDFKVLTATAHITGLAIEKWRVIEAEKHRREVLEALNSTMTEVTAELDLASLLQVIVERAAELLGATGGELGLLRDAGENIEIVVSHNLERDYRGAVQKVGSGLMGKVAEKQEAMMLDDYRIWEEKLPEYSEIRATLGVPLKVGKRMLGVFTTVQSGSSKRFTDDDREVLEMFGQQAAIAIENARLYKQARKEIEERTRLQAEALEQKEYYRALLINNPAAIVTADLEGNIMSWNPEAERLFDYLEAEVVGKSLDSFVANRESLKEEAHANTQQVLNVGRVQTTTKRTRRDGSLVDVELLALPILVMDEKVGFIAIYHDISELKRIERELVGRNVKMMSELELAGEIQASFLPRGPFAIQGWDFATILKPARETSGDFFDVQMLPNGEVAILIADVVDKGVGAALFMALCWSLLRTFSQEYSDNPPRVFIETNRRIMSDTKSGQFLTAFYGVLNPETGKIRYVNAGHLPPYVVKAGEAAEAGMLLRTGIPMGISDEEVWEERVAELQGGDVLALYTDGVTEAFGKEEDQYGETRFIEILGKNRRKGAQEITTAILRDLEKFTRESEQSDDIALMILKRG